MLFLSYIIQAIIIYIIALINKNIKGIFMFSMSCLSFAVGFNLMYLRSYLPFMNFFIVISNLFLVLGNIIIYSGFNRFFNQKDQKRVIYPALIFNLLTFLIFTYFINSFSIRVLVYSIVNIYILIFTILVLDKHKTSYTKSSVKYLIVICHLHLLYSVVRGTSALFMPMDKNPLFQTLTFIAASIVGYFLTFGFILLVNDKLNSDLKESKDRFELMFHTSPDASVITDLDNGKIVNANEGFTELVGYTKDEIIGKSYSDACIYELPADFDAVIQRFFEEGSFDNIEITLLHKNGERTTCLASSKIIYINGSQHVFSILRNITERKRREEQILYYSYHDTLTDLYNRRYLNEQIQLLEDEKTLPISIIIGDVNGLKLANDIYGHSTGDKILQKIAEIIKQGCNEMGVVARWGGDEFIVLLPGIDNKKTQTFVKTIRTLCGACTVDSVKISISLGYSTITEPNESIEKALKNAEDYMYKNKLLETSSIRGNIIQTLLNTLYEKNEREEKHSRRVSQLCIEIGKAMGLSDTEINKLKTVALVHDIGKIAINDDILDKASSLTPEEYNEIKRHCDIGFRIMNTSSEMAELADIVLSHHERWDGKGYPRGLQGDHIPIYARIIAIADSFDAMTCERPYRSTFTEDEAVEELQRNIGTQFDPNILALFIGKVLNRIKSVAK